MYYIVSQIKEMQSCIKLVIKISDNYIGLYPGFLDVHGCICILILAYFPNQSTSPEELRYFN